MEQFEKFNPEAKKVLKIADKIASEMNTSVRTEHVLLALGSVSDSMISDILRNSGINMDRVHLAVSLSRLNKGESTSGLASETKRLIGKAMLIAKDFGDKEVTPEHLLLAVLSDESCTGYQILDDLGVDTNELKEQVLGLLSGESPQEQLPEPDAIFGGKIDGLDKLGDMIEEPFFGKALQALKTKKPQGAALDYFTINLTQKAAEGGLDPIIGREKEIQRVLRILNRRNKNNPVLLGEPGIGKTAIVEGLAQKIVAQDVPKNIINKRILILDLALLLAGTKYRGEFEERIKKVTEEIIKAKDIILFIDELHTIVGAGSAEGAMDAANILKPALARGDLRLVGATTLDDYRKYIEKDPALERRLQQVKIDEPSPSQTLKILKGIRKKYEEHHNVIISEQALKAAVELSTRYISDRFLPDKAVDLIDEAASGASLFARPKIPQIVDLKTKYAELEKEKEEEVERENFRKAAQIKAQQELLKKKILDLKSKEKSKEKIRITKEDIAKIVSEWANVPITALVADEVRKFKNLENILRKKIKGQQEAVKNVADCIKRSRTGVAAESRPLGSFIFLGPTGVGKTELAKVLTSEIYESPEALIKIDMSEFMEKHNVSRLVGAPPGYVGYEEAGKLTEAVRRRPYSVVLFDEIEKAHPDVQNILLQILEDGYLTDAKGRRVNFRNTIIIMTSNIGMKELTTSAAVGFRAVDSKKQDFLKSYEQIKGKVLKDLKQQFRPEFLNRVDRVVVFKPLAEKEILEIVDLRLSELTKRLKAQKIDLKFTKKTREKIAKIGFDPENGARPIRRAISDLIEDPLAEEILKGKVKKKKTTLVDLDKSGNVIF